MLQTCVAGSVSATELRHAQGRMLDSSHLAPCSAASSPARAECRVRGVCTALAGTVSAGWSAWLTPCSAHLVSTAVQASSAYWQQPCHAPDVQHWLGQRARCNNHSVRAVACPNQSQRPAEHHWAWLQGRGLDQDGVSWPVRSPVSAASTAELSTETCLLAATAAVSVGCRERQRLPEALLTALPRCVGSLSSLSTSSARRPSSRSSLKRCGALQYVLPVAGRAVLRFAHLAGSGH